MPWLPPVEKLPHTRLRARFSPGVGYSVVTRRQSASSSSATNWASPVNVPCPISERAMRTIMVSSGLTTTQAFTSGASAWSLCAWASSNGIWNATTKPATPPAEVLRKLRRDGDAGVDASENTAAAGGMTGWFMLFMLCPLYFPHRHVESSGPRPSHRRHSPPP